MSRASHSFIESRFPDNLQLVINSCGLFPLTIWSRVLRNDLRNNLLYNVPGDRGETDQSVVPHIRLCEKWVLEHLAVFSHRETSVVDWLFFLPVIVEALLIAPYIYWLLQLHLSFWLLQL